MKKATSLITFLLFLFAPTVVGQPPVAVERAELSVHFGVVSGKVLTVANYLVFSDDEKPESSFAVALQDLSSLTAEKGTLTIETKKPVRDRSGERSRLSFRLSNAAATSMPASWYKSGPSAGAAPRPPRRNPLLAPRSPKSTRPGTSIFPLADAWAG
jgi:hypothetical protein